MQVERRTERDGQREMGEKEKTHRERQGRIQTSATDANASVRF